ncbi:MAG: di-heme oxidoredictase family protein [Hyphomicrobiaceae bacterium]|nr:di-heme oxidoredictase family protein [Hyphomicrobiaceae bacterium]
MPAALPTLDADGLLSYAIGAAIFRKTWVSAPASTTSSDGLGPLFNARSCNDCHPGGRRGRIDLPDAPGQIAAPLVLRLGVRTAVGGDLPPPFASGFHRGDLRYGRQLQPLGIQGHAGEGRLVVRYAELPVAMPSGDTVSLRQPTYSVVDLAYGPLEKGLHWSPRAAPPLFGLGLLASLSEADVGGAAGAVAIPAFTYGGAKHRQWVTHQPGRFGLRAESRSLRQQVGDAFALDLGLSSPVDGRHAGDCTLAQPLCLAAPNGASPRHGGYEAGPEMLDLVTWFTSSIAVPVRREADHADVLAGEALFQAAGCAACHRPSFRTRSDAPPHLRDQVINPYTDLQLHDMGPGLADNGPPGVPGDRRWRTSPLWGIATSHAPGAPERYLHDGRARSIDEAVLWHGGEAEAARDAFAALPRGQREQLIRFVRSL